jgi:osmoprotectant transport system substrate-binding protein
VTTRRALAGALVLVLACVLAACGGGDGDAASPEASATASEAPPVRIGTKNFTEQFVLGELYAQALRAKGFPVELKLDVGSSEIIHQALTAGALDMYPEYIGVLLSEIAGRPERPRSAQDAYRAAKEFEERSGFTLLAATPFSDQNALVVPPAFAEREDVEAIGDLADVGGRVRIGAPPEFATRFEGLVGLEERYGLTGVRAVPHAIGAQYDALEEGEVEVAAVFTTDGRLAEEDYVILADPERVFAAQNVAPVISEDVLRTHGPGLGAAIDAVSATLTTEVMREMNAAVDLEGRTPRAVASEFLRDQGLA